MDSSILDYTLPEERIAKTPAQKRDESRLLVLNRKSGEISHALFKDLPTLLPQQFDFFRNNAAVLKARIFANRESGGAVECLLLTPDSREDNLWTCMIKPAKRLKEGSSFGKENFFKAKVLEKFDDGTATIKFELSPKFSNVVELAENIGVVPLPPYIARDQKSPDYDRTFDNERYETVYANPQKRVAVAAPTAGLHFTPELIKSLSQQGHSFYDLTLHVGIGTFKPMTTDTVEAHKMHSELYEIPSSTIKAAIDRKRPNLLVGTTSLRALEDFYRKNFEKFSELSNSQSSYLNAASLYVYPPQLVYSADAMITNFHLPRSTLMCLVSAFIKPNSLDGIDILKNAYKVAIENKYNFYSYGDAMLIL